MFFVCDEDGNVAPEDNEPFRTYLSKEQLAKIPEGKWFADYEDGETIIEARILKGN